VRGSFHEATASAFFREADTVHLHLDDVKCGDRLCSAAIAISGIRRIRIDNEEADVVTMEEQDGEILTLEIGENHLYAIIQWNDFVGHRSATLAYRIEGAATAIQFSSP
jgi:hypothetical protein